MEIKDQVLYAVQDKSLKERNQWVRQVLPTPGNMLFTLLVVGLLFWVQKAQTSPNAPAGSGLSTELIPYQGRLADANGNPVSGSYEMAFTLYDSGSTVQWTEAYTGTNAVTVEAGLFNVMLGSQNGIPDSAITDNDYLTLGIEVEGETLLPRVVLGSVPFARETFLLPDGIVTTNKILDGAVTLEKLASGINAVEQDYQGSVTGSTSGVWEDKCTISIMTHGGPLLLLASFVYAASDTPMKVRFTIDGNSRFESHTLEEIIWESGSLMWLETNLSPGVHTVNLQYTNVSSGHSASISAANLIAIELK